MSRRKLRQINIEGEVWGWNVYNSTLVIKEPVKKDRKTHKVDLPKYLGMSYDNWERAKWKGYSPAIKPSLVRNIIEMKIK